MKKKWLDNLGLADIKYVEEAGPDKNYRTMKWQRIVGICAACFLVIALNLILFIPYSTELPSVKQYQDSEYYALIQRLNVISYKPPKYKNNFELVMDKISGLFSFGLKTDMAPMDPEFNDMASGTGGTYNEVTDNQVDGVIELDRIKRSDKYIFYLDIDKLRVYDIAGDETEELAAYEIDTRYLKENNIGLYLSGDCTTVTLVLPRYRTADEAGEYSANEPCVEILSLDVTNPENIKSTGSFAITGNYMTSRSTDGKILLISEFYISESKLNFANTSTFVPRTFKNGEWKYVAVSDIVIPENLSELRYTVVTRLDERTLTPDGNTAFLSYSTDAYVTGENIYLTHPYVQNSEKNGQTYTETVTDITSVNYTNEIMAVVGTVTVRGYVKDQYSFDEYEGILRVVTTTNRRMSEGNTDTRYYNSAILKVASGVSNASLYCISLDNFEIAASVIDFAPDYEEVRSVRFDKTAGYVCTSIEVSDPVFFFDLTDINNITYSDTGTIEGYSSSLINMGNGFLLGIGRGDWSSVKIEVYEEYEDDVRSVCKYELPNASYSEEYKSYYVNREKGLIGLGITDYSKSHAVSRYILLEFNGYELYSLINVELNGENAYKRSVLIDGYMYIFGSADFKVIKIDL